MVDLRKRRVKLRSILRCLEVHPDNEPHSEFADRISDLKEIINEISQEIEKKKMIFTIDYSDGKTSIDFDSGGIPVMEALGILEFQRNVIHVNLLKETRKEGLNG